jgi:hypothetical protein
VGGHRCGGRRASGVVADSGARRDVDDRTSSDDPPRSGLRRLGLAHDPADSQAHAASEVAATQGLTHPCRQMSLEPPKGTPRHSAVDAMDAFWGTSRGSPPGPPGGITIPATGESDPTNLRLLRDGSPVAKVDETRTVSPQTAADAAGGRADAVTLHQERGEQSMTSCLAPNLEQPRRRCSSWGLAPRGPLGSRPSPCRWCCRSARRGRNSILVIRGVAPFWSIVHAFARDGRFLSTPNAPVRRRDADGLRTYGGTSGVNNPGSHPRFSGVVGAGEKAAQHELEFDSALEYKSGCERTV